MTERRSVMLLLELSNLRSKFASQLPTPDGQFGKLSHFMTIQGT
jgi:hypothetical protein